MKDRPIRLCRVVTVPLTFKVLYWNQLRFFKERGFKITLVSSPGAELDEVARDLDVASHAIDMAREPTPWRDLKSLSLFSRWLKQQEFDVIHSSTPKAGLIAALAGWRCRVPVRVHTYTGQVWMEKKGLSRLLIKTMDAVIGRLSTYCLTDSRSQRLFLINNRVINKDKLGVVGAGSVAGVDLSRFNPIHWEAERVIVRRECGISPTSVVICYIGRLRADKGINELVSAFQQLSAQSLDADLLLVGPPEYDRKPVSAETMRAMQANPRIHVSGFTPTPERYLSAADLFCFPSYREGFGTAVIEAAAMGVPVVASRIQGCVDSVEDGVTGRLVPPKDATALKEALFDLATNVELRRRMGHAARNRAVRDFDSTLINRQVADCLEKLYRNANLGY